MRTKFWRTKYLTGSRVQMKYLGLLLFSMIVPLLFVGGCLYYFIFNVMADQIGIPEYVAYNLFPVVNKINLMLILGVPPLFTLLILWGIILSHRFAGPVERLESELKKMSECGDYSCRIKMRKHDDMRPIADAINRLLERLDGKKG